MRRESGDTLVEVLIATAILAAAVVAGLGIMNFGFGVILNAIERTQVQATMSSQISLVRYARDAYIRAGQTGAGGGGAAVWEAILNGTPSTYNQTVCNANGTPNTSAANRPFYISEDGGTITLGNPAAATTIPEAGKGLWVEAVRRSATTNYIDVYVKACWHPAAGSTNEEARTVVRLYVP